MPLPKLASVSPPGRLGRPDQAAALRIGRSLVEPVLSLLAVVLILAWTSQSLLRDNYLLLGVVYSFIGAGIYLSYVLAGELSLAYNAYFAIGAYASALVDTRLHWNQLAGLPIGIVVSAAMAIVLHLLTRRLSELYLAAVTLLFAQAFVTFLANATSLTGGAVGISGLPPLTLFGQELSLHQLMIYSCVLLWILLLALGRLRGALLGQLLRLQREVPQAAEAVGIPTSVTKMIAVGGGAAIASIAGCVYTYANQFVLAGSFSVQIVIIVLFVPLLGGALTPWGVPLGAGIVVWLTIGLSIGSGTGQLIFAVGILVVLLLAPRGIFGTLRALATQGSSAAARRLRARRSAR
jgi:branched-chain amino acid transport system permease protein